MVGGGWPLARFQKHKTNRLRICDQPWYFWTGSKNHFKQRRQKPLNQDTAGKIVAKSNIIGLDPNENQNNRFARNDRLLLWIQYAQKCKTGSWGFKITDRSFPAGAPLETSGSYFSLQPPDADSLTGKKPVRSSFPVRLTLKRANPSQKGLIHIQQIYHKSNMRRNGILGKMTSLVRFLPKWVRRG